MSRLLYVVAAVAAIALSLVPLASARALRDGRSTQNCGHAVNCAIGVAIGQIDPPSGDPTQQPPKQGTTAYFTVETTVGQGPDPCSTIIVNGFVSGANPHSFGGTWKTLPDGQWGWIGGYTGGNLGRDNVTIDVKLSACSPPYGPYKFNDGDYTDAPEWKKSFGIGWFDFRDRGGCDSPQKWELGSRGGIDLYKQECVDDPVSEGAASFETEATDARLEAPGIPFTFSRRYDSIVANPGQLGYGWSDPFSSHLQINGSSSVFAYTATGQVIPFNTLGGGSYQPPPWTGATLSSTNGVYTLVEPDHTKWTYNSSGYLSAITAATGQQMTVSGSGGVVQSVTTANGKTITLTHNGSLELTKLALPDGREVDYGYDGAGNLTSVTDLRGGVTHYGYDQYHRLLTITDPNGHTTVTNTYGAGSRVATQADALGQTTSYGWTEGACETEGSGCTPTPSVATATDPRGNVWTDTYTADGLLLSRKDPLGDTTATSWNDSTQPTSYTDALAAPAGMTYDSHGNLTGASLPDGSSTSATYTALNDVATSTDGRGKTTSYGYDANGVLTSLTYPDGKTVQLTYSGGLLASVKDRADHTTTLGYTSGLLSSATTALGHATSYGRDSSGRITSITDARGKTTTIAYNAGDEIASVTDPLGHVTSYAYDPDGNLISRTDANEHTTTYAYDADNRLTTVTAPGGGTTTYGYDEVGNLTSRTNADNETTTYAYDAANRLVGILDPLNRQWTLGHDADGNLTSVHSPSGGTISYGYNALGRRTSVSYSDGTPPVSFGYDADGNRVAMTDGAGSVSYTYDDLNRLTQVTRGSQTFTYTYDANGHVASRTYPDGTVTTYAYDDDGNLSSATSGGKTTSYTYNADGQLTKTTLPNGVIETATYNDAGQVATLDDGFRNFSYGYDPAGNVTSRAVGGVTATYGYNPQDRLTDVTGPISLHYGYDPVGNRTSVQDATGTTSYTYDAADQLASLSGPGGTVSYSFDANGNQTGNGAWTYAFNLANQLTSATNGTDTVNYSYDGDGNRLTASNAGATTNYLWDDNFDLPRLVEQTDGTGALEDRIVYGAAPISVTTPTATAYYSTDLLGSISDLSSSSGASLGSYNANPYGDNWTPASVDPSVADQPLGYTGEFTDPTTGLVDLRARQYDPDTARFLSRDPLGPQGANDYSYVGDNPTNHTDPSGLKRGEVCGLSVTCALGEVASSSDQGNPQPHYMTPLNDGPGAAPNRLPCLRIGFLGLHLGVCHAAVPPSKPCTVENDGEIKISPDGSVWECRATGAHGPFGEWVHVGTIRIR